MQKRDTPAAAAPAIMQTEGTGELKERVGNGDRALHLDMSVIISSSEIRELHIQAVKDQDTRIYGRIQRAALQTLEAVKTWNTSERGKKEEHARVLKRAQNARLARTHCGTHTLPSQRRQCARAECTSTCKSAQRERERERRESERADTEANWQSNTYLLKQNILLNYLKNIQILSQVYLSILIFTYAFI